MKKMAISSSASAMARVVNLKSLVCPFKAMFSPNNCKNLKNLERLAEPNKEEIYGFRKKPKPSVFAKGASVSIPPSSPDIKQMAKYAVWERNRIMGSQLILRNIIDAHMSLGGGVVHEITLEVVGGAKPKECYLATLRNRVTNQPFEALQLEDWEPWSRHGPVNKGTPYKDYHGLPKVVSKR